MQAHGRARIDSRDSVPLAALLLGGIVSCAASVSTFRTEVNSQALLWLLVAMIGIAQLMPIEVRRGGTRIVFALPYVVALAVFFGPASALAGDVLGLMGGSIIARLLRREVDKPERLIANLCVACIGVFAGSCLMHFGQVVTPRQLVWALAFTVGYVVANFSLVLWMESRRSRRSWIKTEMAARGLNLRSLSLYTLLGLAVTSLIAEGLMWLVPVSLIPIWALRTSLLYQSKLYDNYYGTIAALNLMLQRAHPYTHGHLERVAETAEEVARNLGLSPERARLVHEAAILHDIGKIAVDEEILDKPAKLTPEELEHVRLHAVWGAEILNPVREFSAIVPWIRHHHERPDGTGYPDRLSDAEIPVESKIIAVVDAFDAMIGSDDPNGKRTYRESMTIPQALAELERCSGSQFDPEVVRAFRSVVEAEVA